MKKQMILLTLAASIAVSSAAGCGTSTPAVASTAPASDGQTAENSENAGVGSISPASAEAAVNGEGAVTVTDQTGREVTLDKPAEKIVSCYYLVTASLIPLGEKESLVGIETKADTRGLYQLAAPELLDLPGVGSGKEINVEKIAALSPDVVILPKKQKDAAEKLTSLGIPTVVVNPETYDDFNGMIRLLGDITGRREKAEELVSYYDRSVEEIRSLVSGAKERPSVYLCGSDSVLRAAAGGMYQDEMIRIAGGTPVTEGLPDNKWVDITAEQLLAYDPEYIFNVSYSEFTTDDIRNNTALAEVRAVKEGRLFTVPSRLEAWDYPQPSSILGIYWMTSVLHPELLSEDDYVKKAQEFYKTWFDIDITKDQL